jgi:hypothetical protein
VTTTKSVNFFGTVINVLAIATLLVGASGSALARDRQANGAGRQRAANVPRATQPHTRTTERQRTENGRTRSDTWTGADGKTATRDAVVTNDPEAGTHTRNVDYTGPNGNTASVDSVRTRTEDGFTRSTTATNKDGETATRDLTVSRDKEAGTVTRESNYTTFDGREGAKSDVIQRTDDGYSRDTARTLPDGETHTRAVDVSCDKDARKCVKQVEAGQP